MLGRHRRPLVRLRHRGGQQAMRASMVFIGANPLQLDELAPDIAAQVERGALVVVVVRAIDAPRSLAIRS